ncbi:MAG: hypothetical protein NDJ24_10545 [Alphaproteobacteria bacterium]|nr:hypothetical protein [Alphaproteobacteria bacterium]
MASTMKTMQRTILTSIFALSTVAFSAQAAQYEHDAYGLRSNPTCMDTTDAEDYFVAVKGRSPSGLKAETDKWSLELYENKGNKSWVILAKDKRAPKSDDKVCVLAIGEGPYQNYKWYTNLLAKKPLPNNIATETVVTPKPKLN